MKVRNRMAAVAVAGILSIPLLGASATPGDDTKAAAEIITHCVAFFGDAETPEDRICVSDKEDLEQAVLEQLGGVLIWDVTDEKAVAAAMAAGTAARGGVAPRAIVAVATIWDQTFYLGNSFTFTASIPCTGNPSANWSSSLAGAFNDLAESGKNYNGCRTRLYQNSDQTGTTYGYYSTDIGSFGSFNNQASAIRVRL